MGKKYCEMALHMLSILTLGKDLHFVAKVAVELLVGRRRPGDINHDDDL